VSARELFLRPELAPLLLLAPVAWLVMLRMDRAHARHRRALFGVRATVLAPAPRARRPGLRRALAATALLAALVALLQPAWGERPQASAQRGVDLLVCLDVSRSMRAQDLEPDRLEAAKRELTLLAERARGDRLGLVLFAGEARLAVPLTQDLGSFVQLLAQADPLSVERGGTDLGAALDAALRAFEGASGEHEAVLLVTDGEDHAGRGLMAAEALRARGIAVHCAGVGTSRGARVPVEGGFLVGPDGQDVVTALDPASLGRIAAATGGSYTPLRPRALVDLYEQRVLPMARKAFDAEQRRERENRFQWPLAAAFLLWILELCWVGRARR
jgi:Ca-activated chloride channel family protein